MIKAGGPPALTNLWGLAESTLASARLVAIGLGW